MDRIKELIALLNEANEAYYGDGEEIMSNKEYDDLYDELVRLENETGIVLSNSPTQSVGHSIATKLPKEEHEKPMLSLAKTKQISEIADFIGDHEAMISWKLDGLTVVLTYDDGKLVKGLTRGNGTIGEVITDNVRCFKNIPLQIPIKDRVVIRGEAVIKYSDFETLNEKLPIEEKYKNPRNLCSGSVRQLDSKITKQRNVYFYAFQLVLTNGESLGKKKSDTYEWLKKAGFDVVEYEILENGENTEKVILDYKERIKTFDVPSDGLVATYNDIEYSKSLGTTVKHPRDSIAFKWMDEIRETKLIDVIWSASRTGLINPVASFEPVELEGTTVKQASIHNISILKSLKLGIGDTITVYKANMIIPQIAENKTMSDTLVIPCSCPVCGGLTEQRTEGSSTMLYCINPECPAKLIKRLEHYVSRNCANIEGMSEATLKKFIEEDIISDVLDIYHLDNYKDKILSIEGFGEKSYDNIISSVDASRKIKLSNFINALGISNVGYANAKQLAKQFKTLDRIMNAEASEITTVDGFGDIVANNVYNYFNDGANREIVIMLSEELEIEELLDNDTSNSPIDGLTFVITGTLNKFENRDALKEKIESLGAKATNKVTGNTNYLINNDINSSSSKNKDAKKLNIPIITEDDFLEMIGESNE